MKKDLLIKTIISCIVGAVLWCGIDFIICAIKQISFTDTFFTPKNLIELVVTSAIAGFVYYNSQKKKQD